MRLHSRIWALGILAGVLCLAGMTAAGVPVPSASTVSGHDTPVSYSSIPETIPASTTQIEDTDMLDPVVTVEDPSPGKYNGDLLVTWSTVEIHKDVVRIDIRYDGETSWRLVADNVTDDGNHTFSSAEFPDGKATIRVTATDKAGNEGSNTSDEFTIDNTGPAISVTSPPDGADLDAPPKRIEGVTDDVLSSVEDITVEVLDKTRAKYWDGAAEAWTADRRSNVPDGTAEWTLDLPVLADGKYAVTLKAHDSLGNTGQVATDFTLDTTTDDGGGGGNSGDDGGGGNGGDDGGTGDTKDDTTNQGSGSGDGGAGTGTGDGNGNSTSTVQAEFTTEVQVPADGSGVQVPMEGDDIQEIRFQVAEGSGLAGGRVTVAMDRLTVDQLADRNVPDLPFNSTVYRYVDVTLHDGDREIPAADIDTVQLKIHVDAAFVQDHDLANATPYWYHYNGSAWDRITAEAAPGTVGVYTVNVSSLSPFAFGYEAATAGQPAPTLDAALIAFAVTVVLVTVIGASVGLIVYYRRTIRP